MAKKIYFTSSKGGAGATTVAAGTAFALATCGERTLILDGDSESACALGVCGCAGRQTFTVADYKSGMCRAKQAIVQHPKYKNLYIMPTLGCDDGRAAESAVLEVSELFDFVLCDGAAQRACGQAVIITEPYMPSLRAADAKIAALKDGGMHIGGVIVNKVNGGLIVDGKTGYPEDVARALGVPLIAAVPEDLDLTLGEWRPYSMRYFKVAAERLRGKNAKLPHIEAGYTGAGGYFRRRLRERI